MVVLILWYILYVQKYEDAVVGHTRRAWCKLEFGERMRVVGSVGSYFFKRASDVQRAHTYTFEALQLRKLLLLYIEH